MFYFKNLLLIFFVEVFFRVASFGNLDEVKNPDSGLASAELLAEKKSVDHNCLRIEYELSLWLSHGLLLLISLCCTVNIIKSY